MSPKQANLNSTEGSVSQHDQQSQTLPTTQETVDLTEPELKVTDAEPQHNQEQNSVDFDTPVVQPVQEESDNQLVKKDNTTSSEDLFREKIDSLNKELKSVKRENRIFNVAAGSLAVGGIIGANWSTIAPALVSAAEVIVAAISTPVGIGVGTAVAAFGIALFCGYKIFEHRAAIKAGAKYIGKEVVKGAKLLRDKVKDRYHLFKTSTELSDQTQRKSSIKDLKLYDPAKQNVFVEKMREFTQDDNDKAHLVNGKLKAIFDNEGNNTKLIKSILSAIESKIDHKITNKEGEAFSNSAERLKADKLVSQLKEQKDFLNGLGAKKFKDIIDGIGLPKDNYLIKRIFSEHYDEVKQIIGEERQRFSTLKKLTTAAKAFSTRKSGSVRSTSSLPESGSSNSLDSANTDGSTAELLNPTEHKKAKRSFFSFPRIGKAAKEKTTKVGYQAFHELSPVDDEGTVSDYPDELNPFSNTAPTSTVPKVPNLEGPENPPRAFELPKKTATAGPKPAGSHVLTPVDAPKVPNLEGPENPPRAFELPKMKTATAGPKPAGSHVLTPVDAPKAPNLEGPENPPRAFELPKVKRPKHAGNYVFTPVDVPKAPRAFMTCGHSFGSLGSNASALSASSSTSSFTYHHNSDMGSPDSSPRHSGPQLLVNLDDLTKAKNGLNRRNSLPDGEFKPSTKMDINSEPQGKGNICNIQ